MNTIPHPSNLRYAWYLISFVILAVLFFTIASTIVNSINYFDSDFFTYWLSGRLASLGQNPYDSQAWIAGHHQFGAVWIPNATLIYPLPISLLFLPLGLLHLYQAFVVWDVLLQFLIISSILIILRVYSDVSVKPYILPLMAGAVLFRPTVMTLLNGQFSGMMLFITAGILYFWEKGRWKGGAALLPLLALKPNLGVPVIVLLSVYLLQQKKIPALASAAVSGLLFLAVGWLQNPHWLVEFWNAGQTKINQTFGFSPTIWGASTYFCNHNSDCTLWVGGSTSLLLFLGFLLILIRAKDLLSPALVVSLAGVVTMLATPYTWPYDQVLLIVPIVVVTMNLARKGYRYLPFSLIFILIDIVAWLLLGASIDMETEIWSVGVPLLVLALLVWDVFIGRPVTSAVRPA